MSNLQPRENFEAAQTQKENAEEDLKRVNENRFEFAARAPLGSAISLLSAKLAEALAKRKVEKILGKSQEEAEELNEEYDKLKQKIIDDINALRSFEKDKLGIPNEESEEQEML